jgi:hypothetical protein
LFEVAEQPSSPKSKSFLELAIPVKSGFLSELDLNSAGSAVNNLEQSKSF